MTPFAFLLSFTLAFTNRTIDPLPVKKESAFINKTLLVQLVNNVRKQGCQCGDTWYPAVPAITWNSQLEQAALIHSSDMYTNNYFSHAAKDGRKAGDRLDIIGYRWRTYGENIAFGYYSEREVVKGWVMSPGHCKNIMSKTFKEMGVARVGNYWTQVFATK